MAYYEIPNESESIVSGVILNGDSMTIKNGGSALDTTLNDGRLNVNNGGYASKTSVAGGGYMRVSNGAIASETTIDSLGSMWLGGAGSADNTTVTNFGVVWVGGTATGAMVTSGGSMEVGNGGTVDEATVTSNGYLQLDNGATGYNVSVGPGGYLVVDKDADVLVVEDGGVVMFADGGTPVFVPHSIRDLVLSNGQNATVHSGTTALAVKDYGLMLVYGGSASGTVVDSYGSMGISGGVASNTTINGQGYMEIAEGSVRGLNINQGGATIYGGTTLDLKLGESGAVDLYVNTVNGAYVSGKATDGADFLLSDGRISGLHLTNYGAIRLASGGVTEDLTVEYGTVLVMDGGTLTDATFVGRTSAGVAWLYTGGTVDGVSFESGAGLNVSGGGTVKNVSALGGSINASGGTFQNTFITSGGTMTMIGAGVATGTVLSNGLVTSSSDDGGTWNSVEGGSLCIGSGASARNTTVWNSACFQVFQNGQASDTVVKSGGTMQINSGGTASGVSVSSGALFWIESGGSVSDLMVSEGGRISMQITSNTHLDGIYAGNHFEVNNVLTTSVGAGFQYTVFSGGTVNAENFILNRDEAINLYDGGTVNGALTVNSGGTAAFYYGNVSATITENGGAVYFNDSDPKVKVAFAANTVVDLDLTSGNCATIHSNTVANRTTIKGLPDPNGGTGNWSEMAVYRGGIVNDTDVLECGLLYASGNNGIASAVRTNVHSDGVFWLYQSAFASDTMVLDGGAFEVGYWTLAYKNTVKETGSMAVRDYGLASSTLVTSGGSMTVYNDGGAFDTTVESGGVVAVDSCGTVSNTIVESTGTLHVFNGGSASAITVRDGGRLEVASGGILAGDVIFDDGGQLYFDLHGLNPGMDITVDNLCGIDGNPDYRIAISSETLELGDYTFASGAEGFAGTMTVVDAELGTVFGTLTVGESLKIRDDLYCMLVLSGENLTLAVSDSMVTRDDGPDDGWNKDPYDKKKKPLDNAVWEFNMNSLYATMTSPEVLLDRPHSVMVEDEWGREWHNFVGKGTNKEGIDRVDEYDFALITLNRAAKVSFTITSTDKAKATIYSLVATGTDSEGEVLYTRKTLQTAVLKWDNNAKVYTVDTKSLLLERTLDGSGYFISVQSTNANARTNPGSAYYNVEVNNKVVKNKEQTHYYSDGDDNLNDWLCNKAGERNNRVVSTFAPVNVDSLTTKVQVDDAGISHTRTDLQKNKTVFTNFVGFGDASDYRRITLDSPALLSLSVTATDKAKVVISRLDYNKSNQKYTEKKLLTAVLKLDKATGFYRIDTAACKLPANNSDGTSGVYYISVVSTNAKTGGEAYYNVSVIQSASTFYVDSDNGTNCWLYRKKTDAANYNTSLKSNDIASGANSIGLEVGDTFEATVKVDGQDVTFNNFVGFGDEYDYAELKLNSTGTLAFTVDAFSKCSVKNASQNLKITVYSLTKVVRGGKVSWTQATLASGTITIDKKVGYVEDAQLRKAVAVKKATSDDVRYFVSVQSVGAKNGAEVFYNVTATFTPEGSDGAALTMPETDELNLTDDLSFGQYAAEADALACASASSLAELDDISAWQNLALA